MLSPLCPLAAALAFALADAQGASGTPEPPPPPPPPPAPEAERPEDEAQGDTWVDAGHAFVERRIFAPVLWLDRFFSDERDIDAERSRSFLRWRTELRLFEDDARPKLTTGVRATLRFPGLNKQLRRLRIVIAGETRDAVDRLFPRTDGETPDLGGEDGDIGTGDAGLRFYLWDSLVAHADLGGGILARLPPGVYGRLRFRWAFPVGKLLLARTALTGFWRTDTRFGSTAAAEVERLLSRRLVARASGSTSVTEVSRGFEWFSELALLAFFSARTAGQVGVGVNGVTDPALAFDASTGTAVRPPMLDRYRVYTRLRRDVYRRWLFLELEPELAWPWSVEEGRHAAWGVAFRLEVQFQGREAPLLPPLPPPPPEPEDPPPEDSLPEPPGPR